LYEESANILKVLVCGPLEEWGRTQQLRQKCPALAPEQIFGANAGFCRNGCSANNGMLYIYMLIYHREFTSALVVRNGILNVRYFYYPCGARRGIPFNTITAKHFTGQYHETALPGGEGLSFYNARWYDPKLGAFLSADSIVPAPLDPQSFNRYAYAGGNPLRFSDPSGHTKLCGAACEDGYQWSPAKKDLGAGTSNGAIASGSVGGLTRASGRIGGGMRGTLGRILSRPQLSMVKYSSQIYGVPWQITAGLLESDIFLDTELKDIGEDIVMGLLPFLTYTRPNGAGPGVGNVHVITVKSVARYFAANYSEASEMQL
jgi:RHS repeat-associated protein